MSGCVEIRRYHGHCAERSKWPDCFALRLGTIPRTLFAFRIFILDVKINLFLFSQQILFLCLISRVNFRDFEILAPLAR